MSEFCNFEGNIPEVSKTFIQLFLILKITFFVITFFSKVLLTEYELFVQKLFFGLFYNFYHNEID
jgi:hypothetical protein